MKNYTYEDFLEIIEVLRGENGCPWDKVQTHESIKKCLIEEAYEAVEAMESGNHDRFADELGDVLLQVVFHASIGKENGEFSMQDVLNNVCEKMIGRHPHIFGSDKCETPDEVIETWDMIKQKEKGLKSRTEEMRDVCKGLPALMRAEKVQKKAAKVGFDWNCAEDALKKVDEELLEVRQAMAAGKTEEVKDELGDLLFSVVNVARFFDVDSEEALGGTINKFIRRFEHIERTATQNGVKMDNMSLKEMDEIWENAKNVL